MTTEQVMTDIEAIVAGWLTERKIDFEFQSSMLGGFYELGGAVVDFLLRDSGLAWRVSGEYWHRGIVPEGRDLIQRETLMAEGWVVVDIFGQSLETPDEVEATLTKALRGEEVLQ